VKLFSKESAAGVLAVKERDACCFGFERAWRESFCFLESARPAVFILEERAANSFHFKRTERKLFAFVNVCVLPILKSERENARM
jgi:hypothetical protein